MIETPKTKASLAYVVLSTYAEWLGRPSLEDLDAFLWGTATRASLLSVKIPEWRIFGPLNQPSFYKPIVARTGHPSLSIRWATALEFLHFNLGDAVDELLSLMDQWEYANAGELEIFDSNGGLIELLHHVAKRPGMYMPSCSGWSLRCYLYGMKRGGDWLSLPPLPMLDETIDVIEKCSTESYGSAFAAYRVYDAKDLLGRIGIVPK